MPSKEPGKGEPISSQIPSDSPAPSEKVGEESPLGRALFRVMRATVFDDRPIAELDALPLAQLRLLWTVHHSHEATMKDFSERLGVSQSTVTQLADRLVKRGLVDRLADPADRRVVRLRISQAGRHLLGTADHERKKMLLSLWKALSESDRSAVLHGLDVLGNAAEQLRAAQGRPLPPLPERFVRSETGDAISAVSDDTQPVVDLMARRVRGRTTAS